MKKKHPASEALELVKREVSWQLKGLVFQSFILVVESHTLLNIWISWSTGD